MRSVFLLRPDPKRVRWGESGLFWAAAWLPVTFAMLVIAMESTAKFSAGNTSSFLRPIVEDWFGPLTDAQWQVGHHIFRKTGHLCGYGFVALTFLRAWLHTFSRRLGLTTGMWRLQSCAAAVGCTAVVACMDEWHQTFIPTRTGAVSDVGIDTSGALLLCGMTWIFCGWWRSAGVESPVAQKGR